MDVHTKKMIAPIIIASILVLYYIGFFILCMYIPIPLILKFLLGLVPLLLAGVSVYVLAERIKEIRSGEEDDLSKY
ncbi:MAG TPA: hypothetical protein DCZ40_12245 [Lachnospiraceae bacterium]|nr:hypothetical protein [Lachnospiraceae bacterium]